MRRGWFNSLTTHTRRSSPARNFFNTYLSQLGVARDAFFQLGANQDPGAGFNMTVFALRMSEFHNAVSQCHAQVARGMWASVFPNQMVLIWALPVIAVAALVAALAKNRA